MAPESLLPSATLRQLVGPAPDAPPSRFALGHEALDAALEGGLAYARLHEIVPAGPDELASAAGFALMLALRAGGRQGNIVWIAEDRLERRVGRMYAPGIAELGADPARLLFVAAPDEKAALRTAADVVRSPAAGTAVVAPYGPAPLFDLTATRRLTLFAERSGVTAILLRAAEPAGPSAAATRWRIAAALSTALEADAPGAPAFTAELVRRRGGPPLAPQCLEWNRDDASFAPPLSRDLVANAGGGLLATR